MMTIIMMTIILMMMMMMLLLLLIHMYRTKPEQNGRRAAGSHPQSRAPIQTRAAAAAHIPRVHMDLLCTEPKQNTSRPPA